MYKVIETFDDLMDVIPTKEGGILHRYEKGDIYPRPGARPTVARIMELSSNNNRRGIPLIAPIQAAVAPAEEAVEEAPAEVKKKPRRRRKANASKD